MADQDHTEDPNKHVVDFLRYYCASETPFDYAVMLKGPWGSGKTYLIKNFLAAREQQDAAKHLYVSLYGISSPRQIEEEFYRQLHPILASKGMKIVAGIAKATLKATLKVDVTGDGKENISFGPQLPDIDLVDYFKTSKDRLLVFDDLERCSFPISQVIGYINAFVEHEGFKVVILANETQILNRSDDAARYAEIKEKLIGQTLEVCSTVRSAIKTFYSLIRRAPTREFLEQNEEEILLPHSQSGTHNLRLLKQSLWDFERLGMCLLPTHWANSEATGILLQVVLALSFQVRSGKLSEEHFAAAQQTSGFVKYMRQTNKEEPSVADKLETIYPTVHFDQTVIGFDHLKALLFGGSVERTAVTAALNLSQYYAPADSEPAW